MSKNINFDEAVLILEVSRDDTKSVVRRSYNSLRRRYHPDKNNDENAEQMFIKVQKAYEKVYDLAPNDNEVDSMISNISQNTLVSNQENNETKLIPRRNEPSTELSVSIYNWLPAWSVPGGEDNYAKYIIGGTVGAALGAFIVYYTTSSDTGSSFNHLSCNLMMQNMNSIISKATSKYPLPFMLKLDTPPIQFWEYRYIPFPDVFKMFFDSQKAYATNFVYRLHAPQFIIPLQDLQFGYFHGTNSSWYGSMKWGLKKTYEYSKWGLEKSYEASKWSLQKSYDLSKNGVKNTYKFAESFVRSDPPIEAEPPVTPNIENSSWYDSAKCDLGANKQGVEKTYEIGRSFVKSDSGATTATPNEDTGYSATDYVDWCLGKTYESSKKGVGKTYEFGKSFVKSDPSITEATSAAPSENTGYSATEDVKWGLGKTYETGKKGVGKTYEFGKSFFKSDPSITEATPAAPSENNGYSATEYVKWGLRKTYEAGKEGVGKSYEFGKSFAKAASSKTETPPNENTGYFSWITGLFKTSSGKD